VWILGSSLHGADLAAKLGLPYAFASHFAPRFLMQAIAHYRNNFKPSAQLAEPYVMAGVNLFLGDTNEKQSTLPVHISDGCWIYMGRPGLLQPPVENYIASLPSHERQVLNQVMAFTAAGDKRKSARGYVRLSRARGLTN
jgi:alkanesulfonate monooxygenase SsuD/methylene tetrahydromethanopterin reductase-like flavin-dependent oxidoreductase (luciferase family)